MSVQPILQIKNLSKKIGKKTIINNLSIDVYPGEVLGFLGPNGAGKTTTIRLMMGLIRPNSGDVFIKGKSITNNFTQAIAHVGGIVEIPELYNYLSGYQNLVHFARMSTGVDKKRIAEIVQLVGLEKRINDKVQTYSMGMKQRLGLAQALLHKPSLLVLDEPTNGLDPAGIREILNYLHRLAREEEVAVFMSSHLMAEMEQLCDRIAVINNGSLVKIQQVKEVIREDQLVKMLFIVDPIPAAKSVLAQIETIQNLEEQEQGVVALIAKQKVPEANAALMKNGINVYGINAINKTLEDKYLEMTGGNTID